MIAALVAALMIQSGTGMIETYRDQENINEFFIVDIPTGTQLTFSPIKTTERACRRSPVCSTVILPDGLKDNTSQEQRDERGCMFRIRNRVTTSGTVFTVTQRGGQECVRQFQGTYSFVE